MRHSKSRFQLNRFTSWRKATLNSLTISLLLYESIRTTRHKAKAVKPLIDKLISLAKENTLFGRRQAYKILGEHRLVSLLFNDIAKRFSNNVGGYTRIINLGQRRGDNASMVILELTQIKKKEPKKPKKEKEKLQIQEEKPKAVVQKPIEEKKPKTEAALKEKPPITKKPTKSFLGGLRKIFKKERDSL